MKTPNREFRTIMQLNDEEELKFIYAKLKHHPSFDALNSFFYSKNDYDIESNAFGFNCTMEEYFWLRGFAEGCYAIMMEYDKWVLK